MSDLSTLHHTYLEQFGAVAHDLVGVQSTAALLARAEGIEELAQDAFRALAHALEGISDNVSTFGEYAEKASIAARGVRA